MASNSNCTIALCQASGIPLDVAHNVSKVIDGMKAAAAAGADLLIFSGELYLSDYTAVAESMDPRVVANLKQVAEEKNGPSFQKISAAAKENRIAVIYGYPELDGSSGANNYYNSAQLVSEDGVSLMNYRKVHLWGPTEGAFTEGSEYYASELNGFKVGVLICYDLDFPESVRTLAQKGAQIVVVLTAVSDSQYNNISKLIVPARALDNQLYVAYSNYPGKSYVGQSHLASPGGKTVVCAGEEEAMLFTKICSTTVPEQNNQ